MNLAELRATFQPSGKVEISAEEGAGRVEYQLIIQAIERAGWPVDTSCKLQLKRARSPFTGELVTRWMVTFTHGATSRTYRAIQNGHVEPGLLEMANHYEAKIDRWPVS